MAIKKHLWQLLLLLFLSLVAMRTFWGPGFYDGHDSQAHIVRLWQFDKVLRSGQFPPAWAPDLYAGRGYPLFIFAYPLPYFIAESFHLLGADFAVSLKLTLVLAYFSSVVGMYFLSGLVGAILWGFAPYMFVKIFITGSLGVVVAYAFIPWFFWAVKQKKWLGASIFLSLWILSHPGKLVIFGPLLLLVFLQNRTAYRRFLFSILLALGLSAWYFLPANLELPYTHFKDFVSHGYVNDFVPFSRLLYSQWGTNAPGWGDNSLSQQVGIAQWLAIVLSLFFWRKLWPYLLVFSLSIFLMLPQSKFIWDLPTPLQQVSTPWRFLSLAVFTAAISGALAVKMIQSKFLRYLAAALLIGLALYGNRNHLRINEVRFYDQAFFDNYTGVAAGWNEYLPIWVKEVDYVKSKDQLNTLYYPGWQVTVDGQKVAIKPGVNGLITFAVPPGDHQIAAKFLPTWWRYLAGLISLFSVLVLIWQLKKK
ncbi:MAG: YfhO family protein [Patescibacteria group bacterium]